ncbi:cell division protein FtsQ/DivIB [Sphingobacterium corticibacterium]|uniref:Cell division protein FtsQ n=1 Tax=Sphingobacterium corticibacterium TaxID=2484746 RepID=A0A4Q6XPW5_9SPHI|nr:cell division protein FtsQ [Sphingobacterium corticibacterium]RZF59414.1 cell division protein FtsQ [Sphingobacterium corticibacterium]
MLKVVRYIPWRQLGYVCLGLLVLVGIGMLMSLVKKKDTAQACVSMKVIVEGKETFIDQHDISDLVNKTFGNVVGKPLKDIPTDRIERALMELPYVSSAEIYADMDGVLQIVVQQREVILRIVNGAGKEYYIDTKGAKVPVTLKYVPHVLVANGNIREGYEKPLDTIRTQLVKDLVTIVEQVKDDPLWSNQIVQLYVDDQQDIEIIPRVGTQPLVLGNAAKLDEKLDRLEIFYKNILPKVGTGAYEKVNVKYDGQIICERRDGWMLDSLQMKLKMNN